MGTDDLLGEALSVLTYQSAQHLVALRGDSRSSPCRDAAAPAMCAVMGSNAAQNGDFRAGSGMRTLARRTAVQPPRTNACGPTGTSRSSYL